MKTYTRKKKQKEKFHCYNFSLQNLVLSEISLIRADGRQLPFYDTYKTHTFLQVFLNLIKRANKLLWAGIDEDGTSFCQLNVGKENTAFSNVTKIPFT